jgi:hypothetical protein
MTDAIAATGMELDFGLDTKQEEECAKKLKQKLKQQQKLQSDPKACLENGLDNVRQLTLYSNHLNLQMVECKRVHEKLFGPETLRAGTKEHQVFERLMTQWNRISLRYSQVIQYIGHLKTACLDVSNSHTNASVAHLAALCTSANALLKKRDRSSLKVDSNLKRMAANADKKKTTTTTTTARPKKKLKTS